LSPGNNEQGNRLAVKVTPNAGRNEVSGLKDGVWLIKIGAPPDKGKANKELVDFLSARLGVKKSAVLIIKGQNSRNKVLIIEGLNGEEIAQRLSK
jgi:uncharacterized protein (TIGR00251 family)